MTNNPSDLPTADNFTQDEKREQQITQAEPANN